MEPQEPRPNETAPLLSEGDSDVAKSMSRGYYAELWLLCRYSLPLIATYLLQYSFSVTTTVVAGHLSADDLAAASIGVTTMNIIGLAIFEGMATALDTLCAQAYGFGNLTGVGLHVQRMLLLMHMVAVPVGVAWLCSPSILALVVSQQHLAIKAGSFLRISIIGLPGYACFEAGKRFLQAQGDFTTGLVVVAICAPINVLLSCMFAFEMELGLDGAALGAALATDLRPILLLSYIVLFGKWSHKCWGGFSGRALEGWSPLVSLSLAGVVQTLGEWAAFEIMTMSSSYIGTIHLAAQTVLTTTSVIVWHIPFSVGVAVSTRIGHLIGGGLVPMARRAAVLYAIVFSTMGLFDGLVLYSVRHHIGPIFSDDDSVRDVAAKSMLAVSAFQVIDAVCCGCNGVLRGLGRQPFASWVVLVANYLVAVPLALWLELGPPNLELDGIWAGLATGMVIIAAVECIYMKRIPW